MRKQNNVSAVIDEVIGKDEIETRLMPLLRKYLHLKGAAGSIKKEGGRT
jgi:hypothetical protein